MRFWVIVVVLIVPRCMGAIQNLVHSCASLEDKYPLSNQYGEKPAKVYPQPGDIPVLNRKIVRGTRVSIIEHPYIASIRRQTVHYLTGTIISKNLIVTVAHPLYKVPIVDLGVVVAQNYNDRGNTIYTVVLIVNHQDFNPNTLNADIALVRVYEDIIYRVTTKPIRKILNEHFVIDTTNVSNPMNGFVTGWGRCDVSCEDLCLPRSSVFYPDEFMDPMLRTISFPVTEDSPYCKDYHFEDRNLGSGMLCTGPAREEDPSSHCLAVPGAPLVINGKLLGILSWGFGCGYSNDLPLIYTDVRHYYTWLEANVLRLNAISSKHYLVMFDVTKAVIIQQWLAISKKMKLGETEDEQVQKNLGISNWGVDYDLCFIEGDQFDVRDFVGDDLYHAEKKKNFEIIKRTFEDQRQDPSLTIMTPIDDKMINSDSSQDDDTEEYDYDKNLIFTTTEAQTDNTNSDEDVTIFGMGDSD